MVEAVEPRVVLKRKDVGDGIACRDMGTQPLLHRDAHLHPLKFRLGPLRCVGEQAGKILELLADPTRHDRKPLVDRLGEVRESGVQAGEFGLTFIDRTSHGRRRHAVFNRVYEALKPLGGLATCKLCLGEQPRALVDPPVQRGRERGGDVLHSGGRQQFGLETSEQARVE